MNGQNCDCQGATLVNVFALNDFRATRKLQHYLRATFILCSVVLALTRVLSGQDKTTSKIPEGEAQFSQEQLEQYYLVYKNPDVRYLRTLFDSYLKGSGATEQERGILSKWDKAYFSSKFIVMSRDANTFGGTFITILFQDRPDKVFVTWVYPEGINKKLTLRKLDAEDFNEEDVRRINVRYKRLIADKVHAM
jgi:hypothetical protein